MRIHYAMYVFMQIGFWMCFPIFFLSFVCYHKSMWRNFSYIVFE